MSIALTTEGSPTNTPTFLSTLESVSGSSTSLRLATKHQVAEATFELTFEDPDDRRLPDWTPGSHIDLYTPAGEVRQYSLCGDRWDSMTYTVVIRREADGRGGSVSLCDQVEVGDVIEYGGPRSNFHMPPAGEYLFIAGGIGITPLLPMIAHAEELSVPWRLILINRSRESTAYADLFDQFGSRVIRYETTSEGRPVLASVLEEIDPSVQVMTCGPTSMLDELNAVLSEHTAGLRVRMERFTSTEDTAAARGPFTALLTQRRKTVNVSENESLLTALTNTGVTVLSSCRSGLCGTCEVGVVDGAPDHRDSVLTTEERQAGDRLMACVSRAAGDQISLDL